MEINGLRAVFKTMAMTQKLNEFFKEVWVEMKRVSWLAKKDIVRYTIIVLAVTVLVAAFLGGLDYVFSTILRSFIIR